MNNTNQTENSNATHTPGPWDLSMHSPVPPQYIGVYDKNGNWHGIAEVRGNEANARLIAAAPELLEALQMLLDEYSGPEFSGVANKARAAIAKATISS